MFKISAGTPDKNVLFVSFVISSNLLRIACLRYIRSYLDPTSFDFFFT